MNEDLMWATYLEEDNCGDEMLITMAPT